MKGIAVRSIWAKIMLLLLTFMYMGCNTLKKVGDDELLLTKNTIYTDDEPVKDAEINNLIVQKPNSNLLGYPLRLNLYNLAKEDPDSLFRDWLYKKEKREKRLVNLLSKKQVNALSTSFFVKGWSELLKRIGEPPAIIDTAKTRKSMELLQAYYGSKGYFNNSVDYDIVTGKRKKRAKIEYKVDLGDPFMVDSLATNIVSAPLDSIYQVHAEQSFVKEGQQFDLANFDNERKRLTNLFRNTGVYNFQESSVNFDVIRDTTQSAEDRDMDVILNVRKPRSANDGQNAPSNYKIHRFKKINIYADYLFSEGTDSLQSIEFEDYTIFYKDKLRYKPEALTDAIFFKKDSVYRDIDYTRTNRQITNLNTFRYPNIEFIPDSTEARLVSNIYLSPRPKYSLGVNFDVTHSNIQQVGTAFSTSVTSRNVFGGAETLNISARGSVGLLSDASLGDGDFTSEIGGDVNITFPRIWFPFNTEKVIPYYMLPQSRFSIGTNFQKNIGLDRQSFNTILSYNWQPTDFLKNTVELVNIEFVRNTDPNDFFRVYNNTYARLQEVADNYETVAGFESFFDENVDPEADDDDELDLIIPGGTNKFIDTLLTSGAALNQEDFSIVRSIRERRDRLTENNLIFTSSYSFTKNNKQGINDLSFYQFRLKLESAGNLLSAISNIIPYEKNSNNQSLVFGVPFSQYFKTELDYIKHWQTSSTDVLAFRSFLGIAIPYGNSDNIPFVRSYFAGGSNDNRAWNAYELGPGSTSNLNDFNEANLKLAFNLEYRFPIVGDIKGALFADAGNIWNVFDNQDNEDAIFTGFDSLKDIALGTGFGLRYDFTYFVFRVDTGFKTYNPAEEPSKRWFSDYNFRNAIFNVGINYPF